ncbi:hypothetical protein Enr8_09400 [Blastopirellula retiformator]|uniref:Uncharacterized protein n=1 Tax=Blastopirellula retiformator TaxID=2527970 RepID=A0A5C5VMD8_9BACT|nr:hypothetical protein Enr8_09400 [Blastopirellula retiformator]
MVVRILFWSCVVFVFGSIFVCIAPFLLPKLDLNLTRTNNPRKSSAAHSSLPIAGTTKPASASSMDETQSNMRSVNFPKLIRSGFTPPATTPQERSRCCWPKTNLAWLAVSRLNQSLTSKPGSSRCHKPFQSSTSLPLSTPSKPLKPPRKNSVPCLPVLPAMGRGAGVCRYAELCRDAETTGGGRYLRRWRSGRNQVLYGRAKEAVQWLKNRNPSALDNDEPTPPAGDE